MNRKIISMLLALVLFLTLLPTAAFAAGETPYTAGAPAGGTYTISTAEQLKALADAVNGGEPYKNTTFTLTQDIDLSSVCSPYLNGGTNWEPIGSYLRYTAPSNKYFFGSFDGGGHTVSGLYIHRKDREMALFGVLNGGTVKNLRVSGEVSGTGNPCGVVGRNFGTVENCVNDCTVSGEWGAAGIVGYNAGTVKNCVNNGTISGEGVVGGIVGDNNGTLINCENRGEVSGELGTAGGIAAINRVTLENCFNRAKVSSIHEAGGIAGDNSGVVKNCYNTGTVRVGPIDGYGPSVGGVVCGNTGTVECCYNVGETVVIDPEFDYITPPSVGGVAASSYKGTVKNCYYLLGTATEGIGKNRGSGMAVGLTKEAFAKAGSFAGWDFAATWGMSTDAADPRPVLRSIPEHDYQSGSTPVESSFTDVSPTAYYAVPVAWAVKQEITAGTGGGKFSPNAICTRAQAMTLLWKAMGSPAVSTENSFSDVPDDAYYCDAVNWAVANGVTSGTGDGKFSPHAACTRAQIVTFLWKAAGGQTIGGNVFSDVPAAAYCSKAVSWAVANGITAGTGDGKFSPDQNCTRAQIVTFLWHSMGE